VGANTKFKTRHRRADTPNVYLEAQISRRHLLRRATDAIGACVVLESAWPVTASASARPTAHRLRLKLASPATWDVTAPAFAADGAGHADDSRAFAAAIAHASRLGGGRVYVPPGTYRIQNVTILAGVVVYTAPGVIFKPLISPTPTSACFILGTANYEDTGYADKCGFSGGPCVFDFSEYNSSTARWVRPISILNARGFLVEDVEGQTVPDQNVVWLDRNAAGVSPSEGVIRRIRARGAPFHYGAVQICSATGIRVSEIWTDGGIAVRVETDGASGGLGNRVQDLSVANVHATGRWGASGKAAVAVISHGASPISNCRFENISAHGGADLIEASHDPSRVGYARGAMLTDIRFQQGTVRGGGQGLNNLGCVNQNFGGLHLIDISVIGAKARESILGFPATSGDGFTVAGGTYVSCCAARCDGAGFADSYATAGHRNPAAHFDDCHASDNRGGPFVNQEGVRVASSRHWT
jgi:hypothetical protein